MNAVPGPTTSNSMNAVPGPLSLVRHLLGGFIFIFREIQHFLSLIHVEFKQVWRSANALANTSTKQGVDWSSTMVVFLCNMVCCMVYCFYKCMISLIYNV